MSQFPLVKNPKRCAVFLIAFLGHSDKLFLLLKSKFDINLVFGPMRVCWNLKIQSTLIVKVTCYFELSPIVWRISAQWWIQKFVWTFCLEIYAVSCSHIADNNNSVTVLSEDLISGASSIRENLNAIVSCDSLLICCRSLFFIWVFA